MGAELLFIIVVRPAHVCEPPVAMSILMKFHTNTSKDNSGN